MHKTQLQGQHFNAKDVIDNSTLDNILKSQLGYKEFRRIHTHTSPDYLHCFRKDFFYNDQLIWTPNIFATFTSVENKWRNLLKTFDELKNIIPIFLKYQI